MTDAPDLSELLAAVMASVMRGLRVAGPGSVLAYDATTQKATVQPLIHEGRYDEDGIRQTSRPAAVTNVPVMFPSTSDGWRLTFPIAVGSTVLLVHADRSLDRWLVRGGEVDPEDDRAHAPSDVVAIPTLRDFAHALESVGSKPAIGFPNALIEFTTTQIQAGGTNALARKADLDVFMTALDAAITALGAPGNAPLIALQSALNTAGFPVGTTTLRGA